MPQYVRSRKCKNCSGVGCSKCQHTGIIFKRISKHTRSPPWKIRGICEICGKEKDWLQGHHVNPRTERNEPRLGPIIKTCDECHKAIHSLKDNKELREKYNTIEKLRLLLGFHSDKK